MISSSIVMRMRNRDVSMQQAMQVLGKEGLPAAGRPWRKIARPEFMAAPN
jgi:hypothetical protein